MDIKCEKMFFQSKHPKVVLDIEAVCLTTYKALKTKGKGILQMDKFDRRKFDFLKNELNKFPYLDKDLICDILDVGKEYKERL